MLFPVNDINPTGRRTPVLWLVISLCVACFGLLVFLGPAWQGLVFRHLGLVPAAVWSAPVVGVWQLFSYQFLHAGLLHLFVNMWSLWIFGDNLEERLGSWRFLGFYLLCGVIAGLVQLVASPGSAVPVVGASGALSGVMAAYMYLYPRARITVLIFIVPVTIPALWLLAGYFALQVFMSMVSSGASIAYEAHIGGFVAGLALVRPFLARRG